MRTLACALAAGVLSTQSAPAAAQDIEQQRPLFFDDVPVHWIEPAYVALQEFRTRHPDNLECFNVLLHESEEGGFSVSFSPKSTITRDGEAIIISRPTTCGFGETFHYSAEGRLIRHNYMRH